MRPKRTIQRDLRDDVSLAARFWAKVAIGTPAQCWEWSGAMSAPHRGKSYGKVVVDNVAHYAHRVVWTMTYGPIPSGLLVLHRCDNPPCCNPSHLLLGTQADNNRDKKIKGREACTTGTLNGRARLRESDVLEIRERWRTGERPAVRIASDYGVTAENVYAIVYYRSWKHVV